MSVYDKYFEICYPTNYRIIGWMVILAAICRHALFRETFWRVVPSVKISRDYGAVKYVAIVRFSTWRWFGRWTKPIVHTRHRFKL